MMTAIAPMNQAREYQYGIEVEKKVIAFLELKPSFPRDNVYLDIDARDENEFSYSIKCQHTALKTGNLAFELSTNKADGSCSESWYHTGKATDYLIVVGHTLYLINRKLLQGYIKGFGWDRIAELSLKTQQSQRDIGHSHVNASVGLVSLKRLKQEGLIRTEWNLPF